MPSLGHSLVNMKEMCVLGSSCFKIHFYKRYEMIVLASILLQTNYKESCLLLNFTLRLLEYVLVVISSSHLFMANRVLFILS